MSTSALFNLCRFIAWVLFATPSSVVAQLALVVKAKHILVPFASRIPQGGTRQYTLNTNLVETDEELWFFVSQNNTWPPFLP